MALPITGYFSNAARTKGEIKTALEDQRDEVQSPCKGMRAYKSSGSDSIANWPTWTGPIGLQTESYDILNEFDVATAVFTASRAGTYDVVCALCFAANTTVSEREVAIFANGAFYSSGMFHGGNINRPTVVGHHDRVKLAIGGTLDLRGRQATGGAVTTDLTFVTFLSIQRISD